jgi:hypothetical protein
MIQEGRLPQPARLRCTSVWGILRIRLTAPPTLTEYRGILSPVLGTSHAVDANGTIDTNTQGSVCCAADSSNSCGVSGIGPPTTSHGTATCISGTGKYAGIQCSGEETSTNSDGVHFIVRSERVRSK